MVSLALAVCRTRLGTEQLALVTHLLCLPEYTVAPESINCVWVGLCLALESRTSPLPPSVELVRGMMWHSPTSLLQW